MALGLFETGRWAEAVDVLDRSEPYAMSGVVRMCCGTLRGSSVPDAARPDARHTIDEPEGARADARRAVHGRAYEGLVEWELLPAT